MEAQNHEEQKGDKGDQKESGFYCEVCDCIVKDSLNYLDHINGKKHNRNLGISLKKFTDCTLDEVKEMLELKKRERDEKAFGYSLDDKSEQEEERRRRLNREKKKRQRLRKLGGLDSDEEDEEVCEDKSAEAGEDSDDDDDDDNMAKLMGFSSFSTTKK